jgi:hypothetical protein
MTRGPAADARLDSLPDNELICRAMRLHPWLHKGDLVEERDSRKRLLLMRRVWRCDRCSTERHDIINVRLWALAGRSYKYPPG